MSSIFLDVKKTIGPSVDYDEFDTDLMIHTNAAFADLHRLGCGPENGFMLTDSDTQWDDYLDDSPLLSYVKQFVILSVRMSFDPPTAGSSSEAMKNQLDKLEWMINSYCDRGTIK